MAKYKIPMRRICSYVVEVDAKTLDEAIEKSWDQFGFTIQKIDPILQRSEIINDDIIYKDGEPLKKDGKHIYIKNPATDNYQDC